MAFTIGGFSGSPVVLGGGGGTDWGSIIGGLGSAVANIFATREAAKTERYVAKQQSKAQFAPGYGYSPGSIPSLQNPAMFQQAPLFGAAPLQSFAAPMYAAGGAPMAAVPPYVQTSVMGDIGRYATALDQAVSGGGAVVPYTGGGGGALVNAPQLFYTGANGGTRSRRFFATLNPTTGQIAWFRSAGRPILWSGDLGACKRVNRIAARARRAGGRRAPMFRRKTQTRRS